MILVRHSKKAVLPRIVALSWPIKWQEDIYLNKMADIQMEGRHMKQLSKRKPIMMYLIIWILSIFSFWAGGSRSAFGYSLLVLYLILPVTTFILSFMIGKDSRWKRGKWLIFLLSGVMYMLVPFLTFSIANAMTFRKFPVPQITAAVPGAVCAAAGMLCGTGSRMRRMQRERQ